MEKNKKISLLDVLTEHLKSGDVILPVFNNVALTLQNMLRSDDYSIDKITSTIIQDQTLASEILRVSNSALFSGLGKVTTIENAAIRLGAKEVLNIVILITQKNSYKCKDNLINSYLETLWKHALACGLGAKWLAEKTNNKDKMNEAFLAGLFHDIGKLFLLKTLDDIKSSKKYKINLTQHIIVEVLEKMHTQQGYMLLKKWNLPDMYCNIAREHHGEDYDQSNKLLLLVRLTNLACRMLGIGLKPQDKSIVLPYLFEAQELGANDILLAEFEIILEDFQQENI